VTGLWSSMNVGFLANVHQKAIDRALAELPESDRVILRHTQEIADSKEFQSVELSPTHAMRAPGQSVQNAKTHANAYVTARIKAARALENRAFLSKDDERTKYHEAALVQLGFAIHTLQDSTSPAHRGFQEWRGEPKHWSSYIV